MNYSFKTNTKLKCTEVITAHSFKDFLIAFTGKTEQPFGDLEIFEILGFAQETLRNLSSE